MPRAEGDPYAASDVNPPYGKGAQDDFSAELHEIDLSENPRFASGNGGDISAARYDTAGGSSSTAADPFGDIADRSVEDHQSFGRPSEDLMRVRELEELNQTADPGTQTSGARMKAKIRASASVRFTKKLAHNTLNKVEDVGLGLVQVTEHIANAGEGVGRAGLSSVNAVGSVVEAGVGGLLAGPEMAGVVAREVDTTTEVDISGTIVRDLNRKIEAEQLRGTSNADSPLNTPWILMIFPVLPLAIMYTKVVAQAVMPYVVKAMYDIWVFFGWRFWLCFSLAIFLGIVVAWDTVKEIGPLRATAMQLDVHVINLKEAIAEQRIRQEPKISKTLENLLPPFRAALISLDDYLTPKLGYSPLVALRARWHGFKFDPVIQELGVNRNAQRELAPDGAEEQALVSGSNGTNSGTDPAAIVDRGHGMIVTEEGDQILQQDGVQFDSVEAAEVDRQRGNVKDVDDLQEQFFNVELCLSRIEEIHREYTSIWIEWVHRGMVVDRSVIRGTGASSEWTGTGANFGDYILKGEVRLPKRADTTKAKGGFSDVPVKLILKGRDGLPLYSNDGARRYMRDSPRIYVIGEIELSALRIGIGAEEDAVTRSLLRIPFHAPGQDRYRAAVLYASGRFTPIDTSSYSYRQMLSPLPNGEWTIRINVYELRNLRGVDASLSSDPFVQATTLGMSKSTDRQRKTLSCMVNQLLFFSRVCTGLEFEDEKIVIDVMDWNLLGGSRKIGVYTLDAKRVLELDRHEIYRKWFALQDPSGGRRPAGFIKMSITIVPPGGSPEQHDDYEDTEEFTSATLLKNTILRAPKMSYKNWAIHITVGWADMLPRMASAGYRDAVRGYMTFDYSGWDQQVTGTCISVAKEVVDPNIGDCCRVMPQRRVIWNQEYVLPLTVVNERVSQEGIHLKVYHRVMPRLHAPFRANQLVGQVNVSFYELFKNMCTAVVRGQPADNEEEGDRIQTVAMMKPRYYNFYGAPDGPADPYDKGVAFRGRVLIGVAAKPGDIASPFIRNAPPPPRPKLDFYKLDFVVLRATELSLPNGWAVYVECRIGLYSFGHTIPKVFVQNQGVFWEENCVVSIPNLQFPEDVEQIPDLFVTLYARKPSTVQDLEEVAVSGEGGTADNKDESVIDGAADTLSPPGRSGPGSLEAAGTAAKTDTAAPGDAEAYEKVFTIDGEEDGEDGREHEEVSHLIPNGTNTEGDGTTWQPKAFLRLPAKNLICGQTEPRWMFMDFPGNNVLDSTDTKVPGSLLLSTQLSRFDPTAEAAQEEERGAAAPSVGDISLVATPPHEASQDVPQDSQSIPASPSMPPRASSVGEGDMVSVPSGHAKQFKSRTYSLPLGTERRYVLRALIWQGRNLPAANPSGLSDPRFVVSIGSRSENGKVFCKQTVSPQWRELVEVTDIVIREGERKPNVNVVIYDYDNNETEMKYLGRAIIPSIEMDTADPTLEFSEWYPVFSVNPGVMVGEILADFQLVPADMAARLPPPTYIPPACTQSALRISLVGLRDLKFLKYAAGSIFVECAVSGSYQPIRSQRGAILQRRAYEANCNILDVLVLDIQIPEDLRLAPALNMYVYADYSHSQQDMIATACIPLEKWLSEHDRRLTAGENIIDESFGMDAVIPRELVSKGYKFRRNCLRRLEEVESDGAEDEVRLHEVKAKARSEQRQVVTLQEAANILEVGFPDKRKRDIAAKKAKETSAKAGTTISSLFAPIRAIKYAVADTMADLMPDVTQALGIEVGEDVPLSSLVGADTEDIDYDGTRLLKKERGFCPYELEIDFCEPTYGEFLLFRGDNRALGNTTGRMSSTDAVPASTPGIPPLLPWGEAPSTGELKKREQRRAMLEGARPAVGKVKARLDLIELDSHDEVDVRKVRLTSLRSFGQIFLPTVVLVRVYVLRGINLQQVGAECNPYLTCKFYGGYPEYYTQKHKPIRDSDNPNFFEVFESRVKLPGGSIHIEVKDRVLPEVNVPIRYPFFIRDEGRNAFGMVNKELPINVGNLGLGWSETIGETVIDLDARWYNSAWRSLRKSPVETRALLTEDSSNPKGQLEMFVDIFDAKEVDKHPKLYRPLPISKPPQEEFQIRVVIHKIMDCYLPFKLADHNPAKLAQFYVQVRLGNRAEDERKTDTCKYVSDGTAEFNWRMKWTLCLPSVEIKPRLKLSVFDDTSHGMGGNDQLCAVADIKLRSIFDEIVLNKSPIMKKKQWVTLSHPNYPDVASQVQVSMEFLPADVAAKKVCLVGKDGRTKKQHPDYVLPEPFRPAAFSLYNPAPYFSYLIISTINNIQWQLVPVLLLFPFIPMFMQFVFMHTPWHWYAAGGVSGLFIFVRLMLVSSAKAARLQADIDNADADE